MYVAKSQPVISPSTNDEYCPGVEYTFTATITKAYSSMIGEGGCFVTQLPTPPVATTFTFKGKFGDANQKQIFRIFHPDNTSTAFEFKKIKSLFYSMPCALIPNQATITAPRCQIINIPINVANAQWGTNFESPQLCFGSITTYEYQLPVNWSIGANVSTGSNWIAGSNSVTVTSDLSNGVNGVIKVRPSNNCGAGLANNQDPAQIPILRPAPTLSITSSTIQLCGSQSGTYTVNGMPAGSTVQWTIVYPNGATNTNLAQLVGATNQPTVSVQAATTGSGYFYVTATVTHCTFIYTTNQFVQIGPPQSIMSRATYINNGGYQLLTSTINFTNNTDCWVQLPYPVAVPYTWVRNQSGGNVTFTVAPTQYKEAANIKFNRPVSSGASINLSVNSATACGVITDRFTIMYNGPTLLRVTPNPANTDITVTVIDPTVQSDILAKAPSLSVADQNKLNEILHPKIMALKITDALGNIKRQYDYKNKSGLASVNLKIAALPQGTYTLSIFNGSQWSSQTFIKQ
jgi:hypothetical protein